MKITGTDVSHTDQLRHPADRISKKGFVEYKITERLFLQTDSHCQTIS